MGLTDEVIRTELAPCTAIFWEESADHGLVNGWLMVKWWLVNNGWLNGLVKWVG